VFWFEYEWSFFFSGIESDCGSVARGSRISGVYWVVSRTRQLRRSGLLQSGVSAFWAGASSGGPSTFASSRGGQGGSFGAGSSWPSTGGDGGSEGGGGFSGGVYSHPV